MSKSLFEEAIADAKQLRSVAEQNAKNAIIEAVTPKIKEFIEKELAGETTSLSDSNNFLMSSLNENDDDEGMLISPHQAKAQVKEEQEEDEIELNETALKSLIDLLGTKKMSENDRLREAFNMLSEDEQDSVLELVKGTMHTGDDEDVHEIDLKPKNTKNVTKSSGDNMKKETLYELDFDDLNEDKITIDFGKDVKFDRENPYSVIVDDSEEEDEDVTLEEPPEEEESEDMDDMGDMDAELPPMEDEEPPAAAEGRMFEIDEAMLRRELLRLREAKTSKSNKNSPHAKAAAKAFADGDLKDMDEVVLNKFSKLKESRNNEVRKNRVLQQQLNEYRNAIETLREQLSELNLFNAKLLYVNKLTQNKDVTTSQRRAVVEALDGAKNLREAKLLYKSLSESLDKSNSASLNESARRLSPGHASRPITSGGSKRLDESTALDRWSILAGLK
jgi:hypothetical protein